MVERTRLDDEAETELLPQDARRFRSISARCNIFAADCNDIQFACKEVGRRMSAPCESDWKMSLFLVAPACSAPVQIPRPTTLCRQLWTQTLLDAEEPESPRTAVV